VEVGFEAGNKIGFGGVLFLIEAMLFTAGYYLPRKVKQEKAAAALIPRQMPLTFN